MKKKSFVIFVALAIIPSFFGCIGTRSSSKKITIFHTSDTHVRGILDANLTYATIAGYIEDQKKKSPNTLFLDAGDALQGLSFSDVSKGMNMLQVMNLMNYDAMVLGNHEFDFGAQMALSFIDNAKFSILGANFFRDNEQVAPPFITYTLDGLNIAIIGVLTGHFDKLVSPHLIQGYRFPDPIEMLETLVPELRETADVIIVLSHLGGIGDISSQALAKRIPDIDVIIDGHDHQPLPRGLMVGKTLIANAGEYAESLGRVDLVIKKDGSIQKQATLLQKKDLQHIPQKTEITELITSLTAEYEDLLDQIRGPIIATLPVMLDGHRTSVRMGDTPLTRLITDAIYAQSRTDIVFISSGGIRTSLPSGPITGEDIYNVMPFGDQIITLELSGEELKSALEHGFSLYPQTAGAFPQFAGMHVVMDTTQPAGSRVAKVTVGGSPLDPLKIYSIATSTYLQGGGDGYNMMKKRIYRRLGTQKDIFTQYLIQKLNEENGLERPARLTIKKD
ncbi:MAG: bifunctional metallophosphatase/5'-nucleotidase [Spirochaetia bacterium]